MNKDAKNIVLSKEDKRLLEEYRQNGANKISNDIGESTIGTVETRNRKRIDKSMQSRFGMILAQQMVAVTETQNHKKLMKVVDSLIQPNDTDKTIQRVQQAIKQVTQDRKTDKYYPFRGSEHVFASGGQSYLVTSLESSSITKLLESTAPNRLNELENKLTNTKNKNEQNELKKEIDIIKNLQTNIHLSEKEREKLACYKENMDRSKDLSQITRDFMWTGGYKKENHNLVKLPPEEFETKQGEFETKLNLTGKKLQQTVMSLNDGESIYIDTGLDGHAMQLVIKKIDNQYKLSTFDSSGALESTEAFTRYKIFGLRIPNPINLAKLIFLGEKGMRKNAYTITVPQEKLQSETGHTYLTELIRSNTRVGWAEQREQLNLAHTTLSDRNNMGLFQKIASLANRAEAYILYKQKFASISDKPPTYEKVLQRPQNTMNCFAKKAQSCELYELGRPTYKKLRLAILLQQREGLINDATESIANEDPNSSYLPSIYANSIKKLEPQILSPSELHELSIRLCELKQPPSPEYYKNFFNALYETRERLIQSNAKGKKEAIEHIDNKIANHAKDFYLYLKSTQQTAMIDTIFIDQVKKDSFDWNSGTMPLKMTNGTLDEEALEALSQFSAAQAWKAIVQMINHQIKKLSVNERTLDTTSERLPHASNREAKRKVTTEELENANIVRFYKGFSRKEEIKVELNVGGIRKEINKEAFFDLVVANKELLATTKVMGLLDYLRNISPELEKRYVKKVYPHQRQALINHLAENIKKTQEKLVLYTDSLEEKKDDLIEKMKQFKQDISLLNEAITAEKDKIGLNKNSIKLQNLELQLRLFTKDHDQLDSLITELNNSIIELRLTNEGSSTAKITQAWKSLGTLLEKKSNFQTINAVRQELSHAQQLINNVEKNLNDIHNKIEITEVSNNVNSRVERMNEYRQTVIKNHLKTNAEYRILEELADGKRLGTEKDRNRDMYQQSAQERHEFYKQGKNSFLPGSVFYEIQHLNKKIKTKVEKTIEQQILLKNEYSHGNTLDTLGSTHNGYTKTEQLSQEISKQPMTQEIKDEWVNGMFAIWLHHENPDSLYRIQEQYPSNPNISINQSFHHFLEQKANIKYAVLKEAGYKIELTQDQIQKMGWKPIAVSELETFHQKRQKIIGIISERFKNIMDKRVPSQSKEKAPTSESAKLKNIDLQYTSSFEAKTFVPPNVIYITQEIRQTLDGSTLKFLRENSIPTPKTNSKQHCVTYFNEAKNYLHKLKSHNGLENKGQRITEFCLSSASTIFDLPHIPPETLVKEIANTLIDRYRNDENSIKESFLKLENNERSQILTALIKLSLSQIAADNSQNTKVNSKFYSIIKQWERLIEPMDENISKKIALLSPGGTKPINIDLLNEIDIALHESPVSLEKLYEGQKGLQKAITIYGIEKGTNIQLRKISDLLEMRNGDALLAHQFINYYSNSNILFSNDGLYSTQGRELFSRALLDAFQHASSSEKQELLNFIHQLEFNDENAQHKLKSPHQVFIDELLLRCSNLDSKAFQENTTQKTEEYNPESTEAFIKSLTDDFSMDGLDRIFGFAKEINIRSLQIEHVLKNQPVDTSKLDTLFSKLICSNLAYQLLLEQAGEDVLANLKENFEYTREMSLAQTNMNHLQEKLIHFSNNLDTSNFYNILTQYITDKKFDGPPIRAILASKCDIPGFISLGDNRCLDALHGVVYVGNNRLGVMPAHIQSHIALQELKVNNLPFKPLGGGYAYSEDSKIKVFVLPSGDGDLTIQRELTTLDSTSKMLQYIDPEKMDSVPECLKRKLLAAHFFLDSEGIIHAYTSDFKPILKLSHQNSLWSGELLDHQGNITNIKFETSSTHPIIQNLSRVFPTNEMMSVDKNTVYIPSIEKYILHNDQTNSYLITDNLTESTSRKHFKITEQNSALTEKELTASEVIEVGTLNTQINKLKQELALVTQSDLLSKQTKSNLEKKIQHGESRIKEITTPEYFIFAPEPKQIKSLEEKQVTLKNKMKEAYFEFKAGGKDREQLANHYEKAKNTYLENQKVLKEAYEGINYLRCFDARKDKLQPKDFQSILYVGLIPGKTAVLTQLLGTNLPKSPLGASELHDLRALKEHYKSKQSLTIEEHLAQIMLTGIELQHHILERKAVITGKKNDWDKEAYSKLKNELAKEIKHVNGLSKQPPLSQFSELWQAIQSEFSEDKKLQALFSKPVNVVIASEKKPISINTKTTNMPIEHIGASALVQFTLYDNPHALIDKTQASLEQKLRGLNDFQESIQAQEEGYYYENYGLFNTNTLEKLFCVTPKHTGIGELTQNQVSTLFQLMRDEGWIRPVENMENKYQLSLHPSNCYSAAKIASYLTEIGFDLDQVHIISDRLETFLYQTAVSGGNYSIKEEDRDKLIQKVTEAQDKYNIEYLEALDKIESIRTKASSEITLADLNSAYLLNDYSSILAHFSENERNQVEIVLNNSMTRLLYYKTELDHLNDIQSTFKNKQDAKAISMLHTRRNYQLDKLLDSESSLDNTLSDKLDQDRKMQRAFLLFESEFSHRCNARQVNIFRGLLLDDETDPDKIDSAQARMGFGKTSLLPLVALYKTGDKLVRFIVPKSALETNTSDMSMTLTNILGRRAIKDDFQRYRIETDPEVNMGENSPRLNSLKDIKEDLQKRLDLYQRVQKNREVLVQSPSVRNSMECQAKIFLDMMANVANEPLQQQKLIECITLLNEIRSLTTVSVFDELDATQDPATTEVNYTAGEKKTFNPNEIYPLEVITQTINAEKNKSVAHLAKVLLNQFGIQDQEQNISKYVTSLQEKQPASVNETNSTEIYLIRAILTDPIMLSIFTEKEPNTDFGIWFENAKDGSKFYDYHTVKTRTEVSKNPLLIAIPYAAANTPKPQGSRFDNPEVTAITTLLYYLDPRTEINEIPHLEFLINAFRKGLSEELFLTPSWETLDPEFKTLFHEIKALAEIEDPITRRTEREKYFNSLEKGTAFRKMLARTIIQEQVTFDPGKANSNRYEQGTINDIVIGFSGTAGETSSYFKKNMLDPAADGNMTLGIMGRENCQKTITLDSEKGRNYTAVLVKQLVNSFTENTRVLIDVGGLCKISNRDVAKNIALQLQEQRSPLKGVIFYDDVTNMKKLLVLDPQNKEKIVDLTPEMTAESDQKGSYFTYYDQSHSRGADIKQMDTAHAMLTLNFSVTNNDYKQAIMRMRKIVDKSLGQSFSTAVPKNVQEKIINDLNLDKKHTLTGNDIAFWLRQKELENNLNNTSLFMTELDSVVKNAILQQQADITRLMSNSAMSEEQIEAFRTCITALNNILPFISGGIEDLEAKYGKVYGTIKKEDFINELQKSFETRLTTIFKIIEQTREAMKLESLNLNEAKKPYLDMKDRVIQKHAPQLSNEFIIPSSTHSLAEVQSETENQSESQSESQSQSQSQTQTHSFSEVANEEIVVHAKLVKQDIPSFEPASISYLHQNEEIDKLARASQIMHMRHLFHEYDPIRCSPAYKKDELISREEDQRSPPVRYFLTREKGDPKIILINQDEANLFKASPVDSWSLYDIRLRKSDSLVPITGPHITSLNNSILKKLNFASYRYQVDGADVASLAQSFEGICTPEQLKPSMNIKFQQIQNTSNNDTIFQLPMWSFSGKTQHNIPCNIEQTKTQEQYGKMGITISMQNDKDNTPLFISSKLNKRILAEIEKQETSKPIIQTITTQIKNNYEQAKEEKKQLREQRDEYRTSKKKILEKYEAKIHQLKAKRTSAIAETRESMRQTYKEELAKITNFRKHYENTFEKNIKSLTGIALGKAEFGINIFGRHHTTLEKMVGTAINNIYETEQKLHSPSKMEDITKKVTESINLISEALEKRYELLTKFSTQNNTTFLEEMRLSANAQQKDIKIWSTPLAEALRYNIHDKRMHWLDFKEKTEEKRNEKWKKFVDLISDTIKTNRDMDAKTFEEHLHQKIKDFAIENEKNKSKAESKATKITNEIIFALAGSFKSSPDKTKNIETMKNAMKNIVKKCFLNQIKNPNNQQKDLYQHIYDNLKELESDQIYLPETLANPGKKSISIDDLSTTIKEMITNQEIQISQGAIESYSQKIAPYVAGKKWLEQTLEQYKPAKGRTGDFGTMDTHQVILFPNAQKALINLDEKVIAIDKEIHDAKKNRKAALKKLEETYKELPKKIQENQQNVKKLKQETSAINKLHTGIKRLLSVFNNHLVGVKTEDFLENHFNLEKIIKNEISIKGMLEFTPPEFYNVEQDMKQQTINLHVLNDAEIPAKKSFKNAVRIVEASAGMLQEREYTVVQMLQDQNKVEQTPMTKEKQETVKPTDKTDYIHAHPKIVFPEHQQEEIIMVDDMKKNKRADTIELTKEAKKQLVQLKNQNEQSEYDNDLLKGNHVK